ncbi:hypothetical protein BEWA_036680 [Theileria equi strain WA]|uniref:Uncharacterized protein n=1 Tax=Theileria equi strain WA TaxID=1537102 RepID=L1LDW4_THEEQ|nr:hypothetical protein BEWA_036680 [Theileria equi strain WA]EKX73632.1 hypothetical protein BEWA_036680 [Theileria equi strain WA]|eukprot:XP_004833084.1 hypothetical protein BEWA_036680 [Theileria equi strain WA]
MNSPLKLDIEKGNWLKNNGIECKDISNYGGYNSYEYTSKQGKQTFFTLSVILYNDKELPGIVLSGLSIRSVVTYFNYSNKLLVTDIETNDKQIYFINIDTESNIEDAIYTKFEINNNNKLAKDEIHAILQNIDDNKGLDLVILRNQKEDITKKLLGTNDIIFDLSYKPQGSDGRSQDTYRSGSTNIKVNSASKSISQYHKVKHDLLSDGTNFNLRGVRLKNGSSMRISGGFPNDKINNFFVYYGKGDGSYDTLLLITLTISTQGADPHSIPDIYLIVKSKGGEKWDLYKIEQFDEDGNQDFQEVLKKASSSESIDLSSLKGKVKKISPEKSIKEISISELTLDLSKPDGQQYPQESTQKLAVEKSDVTIEKSTGFWKFEHTMTPNKQSFKVKNVTHGITQLTGISPPDQLLSISAYYHGDTSSDFGKLLLVEVVASKTSTEYKYYQRATKDTKDWTSLPRDGVETDGETDQKLSEGELKKELDRLKEIHIPSGKSALRITTDTTLGTSAAGFGAWEGYSIVRGSGRSLIMKLIRIFTTLL